MSKHVCMSACVFMCVYVSVCACECVVVYVSACMCVCVCATCLNMISGGRTWNGLIHLGIGITYLSREVLLMKGLEEE